MCDCFLDIACYCLEKNADFAQFCKECVKLIDWNDIFVMKDSRKTSDVSQFQVTYIACCKKFVDFQIDLFVKTESLPLKAIDCNYVWYRRDHEQWH